MQALTDCKDVYKSFSTDKYSRSRFRASASVRNAVTDSSIVELVKEVEKMRLEPVTPKELDQAKAKYVGDFVLALERPATIAQYALSILTEGLPADFYTTYLQKITSFEKWTYLKILFYHCFDKSLYLDQK